jgi:hypothetical protein
MEKLINMSLSLYDLAAFFLLLHVELNWGISIYFLVLIFTVFLNLIEWIFLCKKMGAFCCTLMQSASL